MNIRLLLGTLVVFVASAACADFGDEQSQYEQQQHNESSSDQAASDLSAKVTERAIAAFSASPEIQAVVDERLSTASPLGQIALSRPEVIIVSGRVHETHASDYDVLIVQRYSQFFETSRFVERSEVIVAATANIRPDHDVTADFVGKPFSAEQTVALLAAMYPDIP